MLKVWITPGCPYVMKVLAFINDAKLQGQVEYIQDSPEQRKYVAEKAGKESSSFPAIELPDGSIIMFPEEDKIISYLAEQNKVDMSSLYVYNDYITGVFPRYRKMMGYVIRGEGGWPGVFPALPCKNVMVLGASGMVGSRITAEAKLRGHVVTCVSRSGAGQGPAPAPPGISVDANDAAALEVALKEKAIDTLVIAMGPNRKDPSYPALKETYASVVAAARAYSDKLHLFCVGGAGCLVVDGDKMVMEQAWFPEEIKAEAAAHLEALTFLNTVEDIKWSYLSPAPMIQPGERTGEFNIGQGDAMIGQSISAEDYAIAAVNEIDSPTHLNKRFAVAN